MSWANALFGGPSESHLWNPQQMGISSALQSILGNALGQGMVNAPQGVEAYGGQITPDATYNQQLAFDAAPGLLASQRNRGIEGALGSALSGNPAYQIDPATSERFYNDSVVLPAQRQFQDTLQGIDARYGARFGRSGGQQEAFGRAATDFGTNLAGIRGDLVFQDEQARRAALENAANRQVQGAGIAAEYDTSKQQNNRANLAMLAGIGGEERSIAGQKSAEDYSKWEYSRPYNNPWLGFMGTALAPPPTMVTQQPGIAAGIGSLFSGISGLAGMFG